MERDSTKTLFGKYTPTYLVEMADWTPEKRAAWLADLTKGGNPKTPRTLVREALAQSFEGLGAARYLMWFATQEPANARVYIQLLAKVMPTELTGPGGSPLTIIVRREHDGGPHDIEGALIDGQFIANPDAEGASERRAIKPVLEPVS